MKKFNAQAETHSKPVGQPRASRPRTEVFEQNAQATGTELLATHHLLTQNAQADLVPLRDVSAIFFYFLFRLQAQAHSNPVGQLQGSRT